MESDGPQAPESPPSAARPRWPGYALLVLAFAAAIGVGAFLFLGGDGGEAADSPVKAAREFYQALEKGDAARIGRLLDEPLRGNSAADLIAFGAAGIEFEPGGDGRASVRDLVVRPVNELGDWASVNVRGGATVDGAPVSLNETLYLHRVEGRWLVSSASQFERANTASSPSKQARSDLGPLEPRRPKEGELAPDFALIDARDGVTVRRLSEFRGKAVVLNWYASWCGPCKAEIPEFQDAAVALADEVVFLGVNYLESRERAVGILDIFKAKYPALLDSTASVGDHYRVGAGLPTTFFIDKDGVLRGQRIGQVTREVLIENLAKAGVTYEP